MGNVLSDVALTRSAQKAVVTVVITVFYRTMPLVLLPEYMYCASSYETWLGVFADTRGGYLSSCLLLRVSQYEARGDVCPLPPYARAPGSQFVGVQEVVAFERAPHRRRSPPPAF